MKLTELTKGDIFKWGDFPGEALYRFHSIDKINNRYLIHLLGVCYNGNIENCKPNSFTWRDEDLDVFIPLFYLCEFKKTKGIPCIPVSNHRIFLPNNLNEINKSNVYCSHNKYWYDYVNSKNTST